MATVPYIRYIELDEFYTIKEVCKLFQMEKSNLKQKCKEYCPIRFNGLPVSDERCGQFG